MDFCAFDHLQIKQGGTKNLQISRQRSIRGTGITNICAEQHFQHCKYPKHYVDKRLLKMYFLQCYFHV